MLAMKNISKQYRTGDRVQKALCDVSITFRNNEFVSILGPSGSGKTTLLNIIGGLDSYDLGDLLIDGFSTKRYKDRDWDTYRNHSIGFIFQNYNLIPHQSILANVELTLTIAGESRKEKRKRAEKALEDVGLGDQLNKKPNQLSGGQMQRVAIARALVNDPDILLADEPTGALDSETSITIMELLKKVANDRLVIMVTHNSELAKQYSTRVVRLRDGKIVDDSDPYEPKGSTVSETKPKNHKQGMGILTALSLSFNNLRTKKGRTILTSFAGSIGIIGIALILALSSGMNTYISSLQTDTMSSYPVTVNSRAVDIQSAMNSRNNSVKEMFSDTDKISNREGIYADTSGLDDAGSTGITENDLTGFKKYLEDPESRIHQYIGKHGVAYTYKLNFDAYSYDTEGNPIRSDYDADDSDGTVANGMMNNDSSALLAGASGSTETAENFSEMMADSENGISSLVTDSYEMVSGKWPKNYNEVVLVLDENNRIPALSMYQLGLITKATYEEILAANERAKDRRLDYDDIIGHRFYLIPACDYYTENEDGTFTYIGDDSTQTKALLDTAIEIKVTGIIRPTADASNANISTSVAYTSLLTDYMIDYTNKSAVVKAQEASPDINVLTGRQFATTAEKEANTYEDNMSAFGKINYDTPDSIRIYTDRFEDKDKIADCIENYNDSVSEDERISYTDYVAVMTASLTSIVNTISYVLIAFVAMSLIVSGIMIGIITHISVMERTKEIGILRALGASKRDISQVFNAETMIVGLFSGLLGVGISALLTIPANILIENLLGTSSLSVTLPQVSVAGLILLSMLITVIGGLLPAGKAAKKDPVAALRAE